MTAIEAIESELESREQDCATAKEMNYQDMYHEFFIRASELRNLLSKLYKMELDHYEKESEFEKTQREYENK